ncbi:rRNA maturation RNase YbeY [Patescibacteria group bacterium]|nr:rRNA maturation RNase YbeY [Patescibacteria group bacterium]
MIKVNVAKQSNFPVDPSKLKKAISEFLTKNGIVSDAEVSVAIVGEKRMLELGKKYLHDSGSGVHNVFSFTTDELPGKFVFPPDNIIHLGEIVICFPKVVEEAKKEGVLIDDKVKELAEHACLHLMGVHHKE